MSAFGDWCEIVTRQVRFWPDHAEIARELGDHDEDHVRELERIGYAPQLARQRALEAIGAPEGHGCGPSAAAGVAVDGEPLGRVAALVHCIPGVWK